MCPCLILDTNGAHCMQDHCFQLPEVKIDVEGSLKPFKMPLKYSQMPLKYLSRLLNAFRKPFKIASKWLHLEAEAW